MLDFELGLDFSPEQKYAQKLIRSWCAERLAPKVAALEGGEAPYPTMREFSAAFGLPEMARAALRPRGERGPARPDASEAGASQGPLMAIVMMELSRVCPGFALSFGASLGLCGGAILSRGTQGQKERFALPVMTLEKVGAWALTEPGAGSDAFGSMATAARRVDGGWRLTGSKTFITNAPYAEVFVVYARDSLGADVRAFIVERGDKGLTTGPPMKKMGMHTSPTGDVFLDDVFVPDDRLLDADGGTRAAAKASLKGERFGMTPMCLGIVDRCLEESVRYAKGRVQWGRPIAEYQLVQEKIAKMYMARTIIHTLLMRQLTAARSEGPGLSVEEASACKLYCARVTTDAAMDAVQLKGGAGYMQDGIVEMLARDAKLLQIGGGTDEIQILRIAREVLAR
jgi:alkylation response protein AidB-like acyl-CoA dehydrogenase